MQREDIYELSDSSSQNYADTFFQEHASHSFGENSEDSSYDGAFNHTEMSALSISGKRVFRQLPKKMFGEELLEAKISYAKYGEGSNGSVYELNLYYHADAGEIGARPTRCAIKIPKKSGNIFDKRHKELFAFANEHHLQSYILIPYGGFYSKQ